MKCVFKYLIFAAMSIYIRAIIHYYYHFLCDVHLSFASGKYALCFIIK